MRRTLLHTGIGLALANCTQRADCNAARDAGLRGNPQQHPLAIRDALEGAVIRAANPHRNAYDQTHRNAAASHGCTNA